MNLTQKLSALAFGVFALSSSANAQTVVWGAGSGDPVEEAAAQFDNGLAPWTMASASIGTNSPVGADWTWSADGVTGAAITSAWVNQGTGQWITSPSISNGCAMFDSDGLDNSGIASPHTSYLQTPSIDLTGYTDSVLAVRCYISYLEFQTGIFGVYFSTDGGATYDWYDLRTNTGGTGVRAWYNGWATIVMPGVLDGVTDLTDCRLGFLMSSADYYFYAVDDVSLIVGPSYDFGFTANLDDYENLTTSLPAPYRYMPQQQAAAYSPYFYAALISNTGGKDIPAAMNPTLTVTVSKDAGAGSWTELYNNGGLALGDIPVDDTVKVDPMDISVEMQAMAATNGAGKYRIKYVLSMDGGDGDTANDTVYHDFWIVADDANYSAAKIAAGQDYPDGASTQNIGAYATAPNVVQEFEWGNVYSIADTANVAIDTVTYRVVVPSSIDPALTDVIVNVNLYEWVDANGDNTVELAEFVLRTLKPDTINIATVGTGVYVTRKVKLDDPNLLNPVTNQYDYPFFVNLSGGTGLFYVGIQQYNVNGFINTAGQRNYVYPVYGKGNPYEWHTNYVVDAWTPLTIMEGAAGTPGTPSEYSGFSGSQNTVAQWIGLTRTNLALANHNVAKGNVSLDIFPNPVADVATMNVSLEQVSSKVMYVVTDAQGRVLNMETRQGVQNDIYTYDASRLPAGTYFIQVKTDNGNFSKAFVKK